MKIEVLSCNSRGQTLKSNRISDQKQTFTFTSIRKMIYNLKRFSKSLLIVI